MLPALVSDLAFRPGDRLTFADAVERTGLDPEVIRKVNLAAGLPNLGEGSVFTHEEVTTLLIFRAGIELFGEDAVLQFTRVIAASLIRIADAAVALFRIGLEAPIVESGQGEAALARANAEATAALLTVPDAMRSLFRSHAQLAIQRNRAASGDRRVFDEVALVVGFVDLVGSTALAEHLTSAELSRALSEFETQAWDIVTEHDGRLVKLIGDEAMFVIAHPAAACDIALRITDVVARHPVLETARAGLAAGSVLTRDGDYYGPVVNLAARAAKVGDPGMVVTTAAVRDAAGVGLAFAPLGAHQLRGIEHSVELFAVERS
jgi:adenylate cyclase